MHKQCNRNGAIEIANRPNYGSGFRDRSESLKFQDERRAELSAYRRSFADIQAPWKRMATERNPRDMCTLYGRGRYFQNAIGLPRAPTNRPALRRSNSESTLQDVGQTSQSSYVTGRTRRSNSVSTIVPRNAQKERRQLPKACQASLDQYDTMSHANIQHLPVPRYTANEDNSPSPQASSVHIRRWSQIPEDLLGENANFRKSKKIAKKEEDAAKPVEKDSKKSHDKKKKSVRNPSKHESEPTKKSEETKEKKEPNGKDGKKVVLKDAGVLPRPVDTEEQTEDMTGLSSDVNTEKKLPRKSKRKSEAKVKAKESADQEDDERQKHRPSRKHAEGSKPESAKQGSDEDKRKSQMKFSSKDQTDEETLDPDVERKRSKHWSEINKKKRDRGHRSDEEDREDERITFGDSRKESIAQKHRPSEDSSFRASDDYARSKSYHDPRRSRSRHRKREASVSDARFLETRSRASSHRRRHRSGSRAIHDDDDDRGDRHKRNRRTGDYRRCVRDCRHKYKVRRGSKRPKVSDESDYSSSSEDGRCHCSRSSRRYASSRCSRVDDELIDVLSEMCSEIESRLCDDSTLSGRRDRRSRMPLSNSYLGRYLAPDTLAMLEDCDRPLRSSREYRPRREFSESISGLPPRAPRVQDSEPTRPCTCATASSHNHVQPEQSVNKYPVYYPPTQPVPVPMPPPQPSATWAPTPVQTPMPNVVPVRPSPVAMVTPQPMTPTMYSPVMTPAQPMQSSFLYPSYAYCQRL